MESWAVLADLAARQHPPVTRWQLRWLGISDRAIWRRVREHGWERPYYGVVSLPGPRPVLWAAAAAWLAYCPPAASDATRLVEGGMPPAPALAQAARGAGIVLCGPSAAYVHGLREAPPAHTWLRLPQGDHRLPRSAVKIRYGGVPSHEIVEADGFPVTDVPRTIMDLAGQRVHPIARRKTLRAAISTADALRLSSPADIDMRLRSSGDFRGRLLLEQAVAELQGSLSHSDTEAAARAIVTRVAAGHGLTVEPRPYTVRAQSRAVSEADIAIVALRYAVEIDGPHHRLPAQRARDEAQDRQMRAAGWTVERFSTEFVRTDPRGFAEAIKASIDLLSARAPA